MPVDPDAYMAGAIPTLSRGGSWLPGQQSRSGSAFTPSIPPIPGQMGSGSIHSSPGSPMPLTPPGPVYPMSMATGHPGLTRHLKPSQTIHFPQPPLSPSHARSISGSSVSPSQARVRNGSNPYVTSSELAGAAMTHGLKREKVLGPVLHHGWLKSGSEADGGGSSIGGGGESFDGHLTASGPPRSRAPSHPSGDYFEDRSSINQGGEWEWHGGSPKPQTPEPDYGLKRHSGGLPDLTSIAAGNVAASSGSSHRKLSGVGTGPEHSSSAPSPYKKLSDRRQLAPPSAHASSGFSGRPSLARRHSHTPSLASAPDVLSPKPKRGGGGDENLFRCAQINSRLARLSLQDRDCHTPDPNPSPHFTSPTPPSAKHSAARDKRPDAWRSRAASSGGPSLERRHSSSELAPSSSLPSATPSQHKAVSQLKRTRHLSTPHPSPSVPSPSAVGRPSPRTAAKDQSHPSSLAHSAAGSKPFPHAQGSHVPSQSASASGRSRTYSETDTFPDRDGSQSGGNTFSKGPPGYISPLADEEYDRYSPHPAAPVPERADRPSSASGIPSVSPSGAVYATPGGATKPYLPPMFVKPTRDLPWNREGPAMKTHGIAWLREGDAKNLPLGPQGPRWEVARPPRAAQIQGGSWWESGGDGTAYGD